MEPPKWNAGSNLTDRARSAVHAATARLSAWLRSDQGLAGPYATKCCGVVVVWPAGKSWAHIPSSGVW